MYLRLFRCPAINHTSPINNLDPPLSVPFIWRNYTESEAQAACTAVGFIVTYTVL